MERRALRRDRRLRKAKKKKQSKRSKRFERRRSPPGRGNHRRKVMGSKHRNKGSRYLSAGKSNCNMVDLNSPTEALIFSWMPCASSEVSMAVTPAPNAAKPKTEYFRRQRTGTRARKATRPRKPRAGEEISSHPTKTLSSHLSAEKTCLRCRWAGKRRIVTRRKARSRTATRTQWTRHSTSDQSRGAMFSTQKVTKDLDPSALSCSQSSTPFVPSTTMYQEARIPPGSSEARSVGTFPCNVLQRQGLVRHLGGYIVLPLPDVVQQDCGLRRFCLGESEVSRQVRDIKTIHRMEHLPWCGHATLMFSDFEKFGHDYHW